MSKETHEEARTLDISQWKQMVLRMIRGELHASPEFVEWAACCLLNRYEYGDIDEDVAGEIERKEQAMIRHIESNPAGLFVD